MPEGQFRPGPAPEPTEATTVPLQVAPPASASVQTAVPSPAGDQCPSCGSQMAADQRYCLECGHRRGDPRLPFMDAVTFMDAARHPGGAAAPPPPPPHKRKPRLSANASLIAGVGTLVLAIGVGVLIGRSGESGSSSAANATPQVIKVEGGGGGSRSGGGAAEATTSTGAGKGSTATTGGGSSGKAGKATKHAAKAKGETGSSGTTKAAEEVLKPSGDVKLAPPEAKQGEACEPGTAGCSGSGKFEGTFFE